MRGDDFLNRCARLRGSVLLLGPLTTRFGHAAIARPGGDKIGRRRLDTHFFGLERLGATFAYDDMAGTFEIKAPKGLTGAYMLLDEASVTGTANILMAQTGFPTMIMFLGSGHGTRQQWRQTASQPWASRTSMRRQVIF